MKKQYLVKKQYLITLVIVALIMGLTIVLVPKVSVQAEAGAPHLKATQSAVARNTTEEIDAEKFRNGLGPILNCPEPDLNFGTFEKEFVEQSEQHFAVLAEIDTPEAQLDYALFAPEPLEFNRLDLLLSYMDEYGENSLAYTTALGFCNEKRNHKNDLCTEELYEKAISFDSDNAAIWLAGIFRQSELGDDEKVYRYIETVTKAPHFDEYYGVFLRRYVSRISELKNSDFSRDFHIAVSNISFEILPAYRPLTAWCQGEANDARRDEACINLGKEMENRSKLLFSNHVGLSLQELAYANLGNEEMSAQILSKRQASLDRFKTESFNRAMKLSVYDENLTRQHLNDIEIVGESRAFDLLEQSAVLLSQNPDYNPCSEDWFSKLSQFFD